MVPEAAAHHPCYVGPCQHQKGLAIRLKANSTPPRSDKKDTCNIIFEHRGKIHGPISNPTAGGFHPWKKDPDDESHIDLKSQLHFGPFSGGSASEGILQSQILAGILSKSSSSTIANSACVGVVCKSDNDTNKNRFDISGVVEKAGRIGQLLPIFAPKSKNQKSETGLAQLPVLNIAPKPVSIISNAQQIFDAAGNGGGNISEANSAIRGLSPSQKRDLFRSMANLTGTQLANVQNADPKMVLAESIDCSTKINEAIKTAVVTPDVDPRKDSGLSGVWGINSNTSTSSRNVLFSSVVNIALQDLSSVGVLQMGGYDYHGDDRGEGDGKDFKAGEVIGMTLESAAVSQKKVFIYVSSDGSVDSEKNDKDYKEAGAWTGDNSDSGGAIENGVVGKEIKCLN